MMPQILEDENKSEDEEQIALNYLL